MESHRRSPAIATIRIDVEKCLPTLKIIHQQIAYPFKWLTNSLLFQGFIHNHALFVLTTILLSLLQLPSTCSNKSPHPVRLHKY